MYLFGISLRVVFCFLSVNIFALKSEIDFFPQEDSLHRYIDDMPWDYYGKYHVTGLGAFFVDNAKDCVKDEIKAGRIWEPYILKVLAKYVKPGDNVVDIGAHMGTITMAMSNLVGPQGHVHSFEAERQFFRELIYNIEINNKKNIKPYLAWIANEDKIIDTNVFYGPTYSPVSSLAKEPIYSLNYCKLDAFGLKNVSLMKIDVECTEDAVLDGAYQTIMESRPVLIIEIMGGYGHDVTPQVRERINRTIEKLNSMNYKVSKIWIDDYLALPKERF